MDAHPFADGEPLNIIGHSRGGDVAIEATNGISHPLNALVTLEAPEYTNMQPDFSNVKFWLNVSTDRDWTAGIDSDSGTNWRNRVGAFNVHLVAPPKSNHITEAHSASWANDALRSMWWKQLQGHVCEEWFDYDTNTVHGCN